MSIGALQKQYKRPTVVLIALTIALHAIPVVAQTTTPFTIGVVLDGEQQQAQVKAETLITQIQELVGDNRQVTMDGANMRMANGTFAGVSEAINGLLRENRVNLVVAFGPIASAAAVQMKNVSIPIIAPFVLDPNIQAAPITTEGTSGEANLSYLLGAPSLKESLIAFQEMTRAKHIAVVFDDSVMPLTATQRDQILAELEGEVGSQLTAVSATQFDSYTGTPPLDAVFFFPLFELTQSRRAELYALSASRGLMSFAWGGADEVKRGALLTLTDYVDFERLNRRIAINVTKLIEGQKFGALPVGFVESGRLSINTELATQLGFNPQARFMQNARKIPEPTVAERPTLSLKDAVIIALERNLDYLAAQSDIESRGQDYWTAWTSYFPQISASGGIRTIDTDTVDGMNGLVTQHTLFGGLMAEQTLLSHKAISNISIQSSLEDQREAELEQIKQDVCLLAATAYLDVQKRQADLEIFKQNLEVTEYNLAVAKRRRALGLAGPSEVYRWESEQATEETRVITGAARLDASYLQLNQVLHQPMATRYQTSDNDLSLTNSFQIDDRLIGFAHAPEILDGFKEYLAEKGVKASFIVEQFRAAIEAKLKERRSSTRGYYAPDLNIYGKIDHRFWRGGDEGVDPGSDQPELLDTNLAAGINLSWMIFEGGAKITERKKARMEGTKLELEQQSYQSGLRQQIHAVLSNLIASARGVELAMVSAESARKNLEIATEAYSLGTLTLERLVDAQRQAFNTNQNVASARYALKLDVLSLMRSLSIIESYTHDDQIAQQLLDDFEAATGTLLPTS